MPEDTNIDDPTVKIIATNPSITVKNVPATVEIREVDMVPHIIRTDGGIEVHEKDVEQIKVKYTGTYGPAGPQGPVGPMGSTYTYNAAFADTVWNITHNLGKHPSVTVVDSAGTQFYADVTYIDINTVEVNFAFAMAGTAYLN